MRHHVRSFEAALLERLKQTPRFIQTVIGPRQVGKTSGVLHVLEENFRSSEYSYFSSEDDLFDANWFLSQVQKATQEHKKIIVFDEVQKIDRWSELVKRAWDLQKQQRKLMHWVLLGSSSLKLSRGLSESLAGRFEVIATFQWSFSESKEAFGLNLEEFLHLGGYPASYELRRDSARFRKYMAEAVFESVVSLDIFRFASIKKPALFRQTFELACQYPSQVLSYNKLLGQLQDAGNVDQVKHYLDLFSQAFLIRQIFKYSKSPLSRLSSPKLIPSAPVFTSLFLRRPLTPEEKGRVFEGVVGTRLCETFESVFYWREGHDEVDFVVEHEGQIFAIEVKSKAPKNIRFRAFEAQYKKALYCVIDFENFEEFDRNPRDFLLRYGG